MRAAAHNRTGAAAVEATRATDNIKSTDDEVTGLPLSPMFVVHYVAAIVLPIIMLIHYGCRRHPDHIRRFKDRPSYAATLWTAFWIVFITGMLGNLIALSVSVLGTGSEAGKVIGANLLAFFNLEVIMACLAVLLGLLGLAIALISGGNLGRLSKNVQGGSPTKYVWAATRSVL
jgi:hypothetical protein